MKVLKTIVATAVIVFAATTAATAGVQHLTKARDVQAVDRTATQYTVTLTAKQLAQLIDGRSAGHVRDAQRIKTHATHARQTHRKHTAAHKGTHKAKVQHVAQVHHVQKSSNSAQRTSAGQSGSHHYELNRQTHQQTHVSTGGHDGGHGGGSGHGGGHGGD